MKQFFFCSKFTVIVVILSILCLSGFIQAKDEGKVPITTSSQEALQDFLKGRELFENLLAQESLQYFEKAIKKDPNFALARLYYANAQPIPKGFFDEFEKAVALVDKVSDGERYWILGVQAAVNGMTLKQRELFQKLCQAYPNDERAHGLLGNHYFGQQMFEEAIQEYERTIEINPEYPQVYNQLGYSYRQLENYTKAEEAFKKYTELIPNDPNPYDSYAELKMKIGDYESSIEIYRKALEVNPNFVASHIGIATNYNFMGEHEKGRGQLKKLFEIARNDGERRQARFAMAVSYVDEGNFEKALEELDWMYKTAKNVNDAAAMAGDLVNMGNIYYEMGDYDDAAVRYEKSLQTMISSDLEKKVINNARRLYLYNAGKVALQKGDLKTSKEKSDEFKKAVLEVRNTFQTWLSHELDGMIALSEKRYETAIEEFKSANQQNPYTFYRMAIAYEGIGNKEKAKKYCQKAANHNTLNNMNYAFIRTKAKGMLLNL